MKKSEVKRQIELERRASQKRHEEQVARLKEAYAKPKIYTNMICKSIRFGLGGITPEGTSAQCWECNECGRSGVNTYNLRKQDTLIEQQCDLED